MKIKFLVIVGILIVCAVSVSAQGGGKAEANRIKFAKGKSGATVSGTLSNDQQMEYIFGAKAGQKITLQITSVPKGNFFSFAVAGAEDIELETEYDSYADYTFTAPETGDYLATVNKNPTEKLPKAKFTLTLTTN